MCSGLTPLERSKDVPPQHTLNECQSLTVVLEQKPQSFVTLADPFVIDVSSVAEVRVIATFVKVLKRWWCSEESLLSHDPTSDAAIRQQL